jgi:hypothetical protein
MKTHHTETLSGFQYHLYRNFNEFSSEHKIAGRFAAIPVAILDVGLDTAKSPLGTIEALALVVINLLGAAFDNNCTIKDALWATRKAIISAFATIADLLLAIIKLVYQACVSLYDPEHVLSIQDRMMI